MQDRINEWRYWTKDIDNNLRREINMCPNSSGITECPVCFGFLEWTKADNGHIGVRCISENPNDDPELWYKSNCTYNWQE